MTEVNSINQMHDKKQVGESTHREQRPCCNETLKGGSWLNGKLPIKERRLKDIGQRVSSGQGYK